MENAPRILVVDECEEDRGLVCGILATSFPSYTVVEANSATSLDRAIAAGSFDLVVTDCRVGDVPATELLGRVRSALPACPVVVYARPGNEELAIAALKAGVEDYVLKDPARTSALMATVRLHLGPASRERVSRQAQARYHSLFETIPVGIYLTTPDGLFLDANPATVRMLGAKDRDELLATNSLNLYVDPAERVRWQEKMAHEGIVRDFVTCCRRLDGDMIWVRETSRVIRSERGRVELYEGIIEDITDQTISEELLAATEALLTAAVEQSPAGVIIADAPDVTIRLANPAALGIRDALPDELVDIPMGEHSSRWRFSRPDGTEYAAEELPLSRAVLRGEIVKDEELVIRRDTGEERWVLANAAPVRSPDGEIVAGVVVFPDITERKKFEAALRRREAVLRAVAGAAETFLGTPDWQAGIHKVLGQLGEATGVSRVYVFRCGRDPDGSEWIGHEFEWAAPGIDPQIDLEELKRIPRDTPEVNRWIETLSGDEIIAGRAEELPPTERGFLDELGIRSILLVPIFVGERWWGLIGFDECEEERVWQSMEIEALRTAARTLGAAIRRRESEQQRIRLEMALEQSVDSIVITDADGRIEYVNPAFTKITGYPADEVLGHSPRLIRNGERDCAVYRELWRTLRMGEVFKGRFRNRRRDGSEYREEATISPVRNRAGEVVNFVTVSRDVTREAELQAQLLQAQKMECVGLLASGIAHDFNNLLGQVLAAAELLAEQQDGEERSGRYVSLILEAVQRGQDITRRMLTFSRDGADQSDSVSAVDLLLDLHELAIHTFPKNVRVILEPVSEELVLFCDRGQVGQALLNLALNAVDAMPDGGEIFLSARKAVSEEVRRHQPGAAGEFVCLVISDTGSGIDTALMKRIFEPFYTSKPPGKGTGLGLYIVYGIVKAHGGWVEAESEPGVGTTFSLGLPLVPVREADRPVDPGESAVVARGEHVLVVEDEPGLLRLLEEILTGAGYRVTAAADGEEALRRFEAADPDVDLVITDISMPNLSGPGLAARLRQVSPDLGIVVTSGHVDPSEFAELANLGIRDVLRKPFNVKDVVRTVGSALAGREQEGGDHDG